MANKKEILYFIGFLKIRLHIPYSENLKCKRGIIKSLKALLKKKFNISIAEIGDLDLWQTSILGITLISNDKNVIFKSFEKIILSTENYRDIQILDYKIQII